MLSTILKNVKAQLGSIDHRQVGRYFISGFSTFMVDFGVLLFGLNILGLRTGYAVSLGYGVAFFYNFFLNKNWVFSLEKSNGVHSQLARYVVLVVANYFATLGIVVGLESLGIRAEIGRIIAVAATVLWNYRLYQTFVFKTKD